MKRLKETFNLTYLRLFPFGEAQSRKGMGIRMKFELVERYIYAVTRRMPKKMKKDVALELQTLIYDMLEERCKEMTPTEKDVKVVLTELGTPEELYEQYDNDSKKCLIGQPYYSTYKFVIKIVLICTALGMTIASLLGAGVAVEHIRWYEVLLDWMAALGSAFIFAFAFVTGLFAFFYHKEIPIDTYTGLESLPPVPTKKEGISKAECVGGIVLSVLFVVIFLVCPQIICGITKDGRMIPVFDTAVVRSTWFVIILFGIIGVVMEVIKLMDRKYTRRVVIATVTFNAISAALTIWWMGVNRLFNQEFFSSFFEEKDFMMKISGNVQYYLLGVILFALVLDTVMTIVKGWKSESVQ